MQTCQSQRGRPNRKVISIHTGEREMKAKLLFWTVLFFLTGCSLISTPTATVKAFMAAAQKGDADAMTRLFSAKAIQRTGLDKIKFNNQSFAEMVQRATAASGPYRMVDVQETSIAEDKRVSFFYKNEVGTDSIKFVFDLSKEGRAWKIDNIGGAESKESKSTEAPTPEPSRIPEPPPLASPSEKDETEKKGGTTGKTVSGGVLNGKAISLPEPLYPAVAKAAKASGTVMIQVVIDENGNVESARAVSGHPLLQPASVAAARSAKFPPTKLSGKPVKVTGIITYKFVAP
jgi:TonB family protein